MSARLLGNEASVRHRGVSRLLRKVAVEASEGAESAGIADLDYRHIGARKQIAGVVNTRHRYVLVEGMSHGGTEKF